MPFEEKAEVVLSQNSLNANFSGLRVLGSRLFKQYSCTIFTVKFISNTFRDYF